MKKNLLILSILMLSLTSVKGQTNIYHPFPDSNARWREACSGSGPSVPPVVTCHEIENYIAGDTTIGAFLYKKINQKKSIWINNCSQWTGSYEYYYGAFRQDTLQKKVFFLASLASQDTLLYDFDLSLGDTLPVSLTNDPTQITNTITKIDSVLIGSTFRKRFFITSSSIDSNYASLIEGVGCTQGLFNKIMPMFEWGCNLICFSQNGTTLFPDTNTMCPTVSIEENYFTNTKIIISPNPATTTLNIECPQSNLHQLAIFNLMGQQLMEVSLTGSKQSIDISGLPGGMYIIKVSGRDWQVERKVVKE